MVPIDVIRPRGRSSLLLVCEHAASAIPSAYGRLGLTEDAIMSHIGWDIGAGDVALHLSELLDATLVRATVSRLVIDLNRPLHAVDSVPTASGGLPIPGNQELSALQRSQRAERFFVPFHEAIALIVEERTRQGEPLAILAIHSFTPVLDGRPRPWSCGVAHDCDDLSASLLKHLRLLPDQVVGDNQPYSLDGSDYTIPVHGRARGIPATLLEIRQDLLTTVADRKGWASRLAVLAPSVVAAIGLSASRYG